MTAPDEALLGQLPAAHAVALRLDAAGHDHRLVATALGVPVESVPPLLAVARAKLARLETPGDARRAGPVVDH